MIYVLVLTVVFAYITLDKDFKVQRVMDNQIESLKNSTELSKIAFSSLAVHMHNYIAKDINKLQLLKEANNSSEDYKKVLRTQLFTLLKDEYNTMFGSGVVEMEVVLANNESFLRMHKPDLYGDKIEKIRHVIYQVSQTKERASAFELSEFEHAFRYAYPIFDFNGDYLGILEVGFSSLKLSEYISKIYGQTSYFLLDKKEVHLQDKYNLYKEWYVQSNEHEEYLIFSFFKNSTEEFKEVFTPTNRQIISENMQQNKTFSIYNTKYGQVYVISFYPIVDLEEHSVAYLVSYHKSAPLWNILNSYHILLLLNIFGLGLLCYFIYKVLVYNKQLKVDVLYRKKQERLIRKAQEEIKQYQQLFLQSKAVMMLIDPNTHRIVDANKSALNFYQYSYNELIKKKISEINILSEEEVNERIAEALNEKREYFVFKHALANGDIRDVEVYSGPIYYEGKHLLYSIIHDVTEAKKQEQEIRDMKNRLQLAIDGSNDGLWDWDLKTDSVYYSNQWKKIFGIQDEEEINHIDEIKERVHPDDINSAFEDLDKYLRKEIDFYENEHRMQHKDGHYIWIHSRAKALFNKDGVPYRMVGFHKDITQQKEYENNLKALVDFQVSQLRQKDEMLQEQIKLASMGEMIGAIAHQWRQPLNALYINIYMLEDDFEDGLIDKDFIEEFIQKNRDIIMFMSRTIDDFRNFYRIDKVKSEFSILEAVNTTISLQSAQLKSHNIELNIIGDDFIINGYQTEFQQVILNLINNAKDAFEEDNIEERVITIILDKDSLSVKNKGKPIRDEVVNRVFEPYFTTKEEGKGTGMGLYISKKIIEDNLGGKLKVNNCEDGVIFTIDLKGL